MEREERRAEERIESKRAKLKALFALVFQDFGRYQISLEENVLLGDIRRRDEERLRQSIVQAGLEDAARELPEGMRTPLGKTRKGGAEFSGGLHDTGRTYRGHRPR